MTPHDSPYSADTVRRAIELIRRVAATLPERRTTEDIAVALRGVLYDSLGGLDDRRPAPLGVRLENATEALIASDIAEWSLRLDRFRQELLGALSAGSQLIFQAFLAVHRTRVLTTGVTDDAHAFLDTWERIAQDDHD